MKQHQKSYSASGADYTVDLRAIGTPDNLDPNSHDKQMVFFPATFDIEVVGNAGAVTLEAKGPFTSSTFFDVTDGTFAIAGGKRQIVDFALSELKFTHGGGGTYTVNVCRVVRD